MNVIKKLELWALSTIFGKEERISVNEALLNTNARNTAAHVNAPTVIHFRKYAGLKHLCKIQVITRKTYKKIRYGLFNTAHAIRKPEINNLNLLFFGSSGTSNNAVKRKMIFRVL